MPNMSKFQPPRSSVAYDIKDASAIASVEIETPSTGSSRIKAINRSGNATTNDLPANITLTGTATVGSAPTADMEVATKKYVDDRDGDLTTLKTDEKSNLVGAINEICDGLVIYKTFTTPYAAIPGNGNVKITIDAEVAGYSPIAIMGYTTRSNYVVATEITASTTGEREVSLHNMSSSTAVASNFIARFAYLKKFS